MFYGSSARCSFLQVTTVQETLPRVALGSQEALKESNHLERHLILSHPPLLSGLPSHQHGHSGLATLCNSVPGPLCKAAWPPAVHTPHGQSSSPVLTALLEDPRKPTELLLSLFLPSPKSQDPSLSGKGRDKPLAPPCLYSISFVSAPYVFQFWGFGTFANPSQITLLVSAFCPDTPYLG